jgi:exosome complex component RRP42
VGIKAEIGKTPDVAAVTGEYPTPGDESRTEEHEGRSDWLEMTVEIPGLRDDEAKTAFLSSMLSEALLADGEFLKKLRINRRFHWKLYLDVSYLAQIAFFHEFKPAVSSAYKTR